MMLYVVEPVLVLNIICMKYLSMDITFHSSYVILQLMPSTVIFWTELSCWRKSCSNKTTFLLVIATKILRSSSQSGWPLRNLHLKWQRMFSFLHSFCLSSITNKSFIRLDWVTLWMSYKKQELHTLRKHMGSPPVFLWGSLLLIFLVFCFCVCLRPVSCMPNVVIFSGLSILDVYPFSFI